MASQGTATASEKKRADKSGFRLLASGPHGHAAFRAADGLARSPPFCALSVTVDLDDDGGVDHHNFHSRLVGRGVAELFPDIRLHSVAKARIRRAPVAEHGR